MNDEEAPLWLCENQFKNATFPVDFSDLRNSSQNRWTLSLPVVRHYSISVHIVSSHAFLRPLSARACTRCSVKRPRAMMSAAPCVQLAAQ
jgi:hypothetical protein